MQTFLPYPDFYSSAETLDKKRCWKQTVEAAQILDCLERGKKGWANHPAVKMWIGYENVLRGYFNAFLQVSKYGHYIDTKYIKLLPARDGYDPNKDNPEYYPWWLGEPKFHRAMRARLIEKDEDFYLPQFPYDKGFNAGKYFWPDMQTQTFKII